MRNRSSRTGLIRVVIATGITSVAVQIAVLREFLTVFNGNEFTISIIWFVWLVAGGAGTLAADRVGPVLRPGGIQALTALAGIAGALAVAQIPMIRTLFSLVFVPGTSQGFYASFFFILGTVSPLCILIGFLLPFSFQVLQGTDPAVKGAWIYLADAVGDTLGAMMFTFVLIRRFTPVQAVFLAACLLFATLIFLGRSSHRPWFCIGTTVLFFGISMACLGFTPRPLAGQAPVRYMETAYGRVTVARSGMEYTFISDGVPLFSTRNTIMAEESAHYPLAQRQKVGGVLSIAAQAGLFSEINRHNPSFIDYVELDPGVSATLEEFGFIQKVGNLSSINTDGIRFLKQTPRRYTSVLVNLPQPDTFQVNRFYTLECFRAVKAVLEPGGILSLSMPPLPMTLTGIQKRSLSILTVTLSQVFSTTLIIPGEHTVVLASDGPLSTGIPSLLAAKGIETLFAGPGFDGTVTPFRMETVRRALDQSAPVNRDYTPVLVPAMLAGWFEAFDTRLAGFSVAVITLFLVYLAWAGPMERVLFTTGASLMGMEGLVILAFQIAFGNLYTRIGLVVSVFLLGLIPGAWFSIKLQDRTLLADRNWVVLSDGLVAITAGIFPLMLLFPGHSPGEAGFLVYGLVISGVCGFQIPVIFAVRGNTPKTVAAVVSSDLMGASLAPLLFTLVMVPIFGIPWTGFGIFLLKLISLMGIVLHGKSVQT
ncbi:MAG: hypothetical protein V1793_06715 [Pseudomonadota bacterium]